MCISKHTALLNYIVFIKKQKSFSYRFSPPGSSVWGVRVVGNKVASGGAAEGGPPGGSERERALTLLRWY